MAFECFWWAFWVKVANDSNPCSGWCSLLTVRSSETTVMQHKHTRSWRFPSPELLILKFICIDNPDGSDPQAQSVHSKSSKLALAGVSFISIQFHTISKFEPSHPVRLSFKALLVATIHSFHGFSSQPTLKLRRLPLMTSEEVKSDYGPAISVSHVKKDLCFHGPPQLSGI